jgi:hypothetical protein
VSIQACNSIDSLEITGPEEDPAGAVSLTYTSCGETQTLTAPFESEFDGRHIVLGVYHIWVDEAGLLRMAATVPTAQDDGYVVGDQTAGI